MGTGGLPVGYQTAVSETISTTRLCSPYQWDPVSAVQVVVGSIWAVFQRREPLAHHPRSAGLARRAWRRWGKQPSIKAQSRNQGGQAAGGGEHLEGRICSVPHHDEWAGGTPAMEQSAHL